MAYSLDLRPYMDKLKAAQDNCDIESADDVLCDLLEALGYKKVVEEYNKVENGMHNKGGKK